MATSLLTCPDCGATIRPRKPVSAGNKVHCPACNIIFTHQLRVPAPVTPGDLPLFSPLAGLAEAIEEGKPLEPPPAPPEERRVWETKRRDPFDPNAGKKGPKTPSPLLLVSAGILGVLGLVLLGVGIYLLQE